MPDSSTSAHVLGDGPVLVGVDGSANAHRALAVAASIAQRFDLDLRVVHSVGLMSVIDGQHVPSEGHRDELDHLLRSAWCSGLSDTPGLRWSAELVDGSPAEVLTSVGADIAASFVVVGSRGVGGEQVLGSTSHYVVHNCDRPVVVVPPADRAR